MSVWKQKLKRWHDANSRKMQSHKKKKHGKGCFPKERPIVRREFSTPNSRTSITLKVPKIFSLTDNTEVTMGFFMEFIDEVKNKQYGKIFYIDSSEVETVTVDALIYLIAIMENDRINKEMHYVYGGNYPQNADAKKIYQESGFTSYVVSKGKKLPKSTDKMQIICGFKNDPDVAKQFCNFVMRTLDKQRSDIIPLQVVFIELMSNVYHHAYGNDHVMAKHWYIYAEHVADHVRFVFVDTGAGIARTVRKNFQEKIKGLLGMKVKDGDLLLSTFRGDFRTQTNEKNRGNGLSSVKDKVLSGPFKKFDVISGKGKCSINQEYNDAGCLERHNYNNNIYGTLFTFDVY